MKYIMLGGKGLGEVNREIGELHVKGFKRHKEKYVGETLWLHSHERDNLIISNMDCEVGKSGYFLGKYRVGGGTVYVTRVYGSLKYVGAYDLRKESILKGVYGNQIVSIYLGYLDGKEESKLYEGTKKDFDCIVDSREELMELVSKLVKEQEIVG